MTQQHGEAFSEWHENDTGDTLPTGEPLEVVVVNEVRVQEFPAKNLTTGQVPFGDAGRAINIVPARPGRVSVRIKNRTIAEATVWIGGSDQLSEGIGHQLDPGESISLDMDGAVWAICDTDDPGKMHWLAINRDG